MSEDRKRPTAGFWISVVLVAALAYPLSFGPACWISSRLNAGTSAVTLVYRPIAWFLREDCAGPLDSAVRWYAGVGAASENWVWDSDDICHPEEGWVWRSLGASP
jgi:hypothetical protein